MMWLLWLLWLLLSVLQEVAVSDRVTVPATQGERPLAHCSTQNAPHGCLLRVQAGVGGAVAQASLPDLVPQVPRGRDGADFVVGSGEVRDPEAADGPLELGDVKGFHVAADLELALMLPGALKPLEGLYSLLAGCAAMGGTVGSAYGHSSH